MFRKNNDTRPHACTQSHYFCHPSDSMSVEQTCSQRGKHTYLEGHDGLSSSPDTGSPLSCSTLQIQMIHTLSPKCPQNSSSPAFTQNSEQG